MRIRLASLLVLPFLAAGCSTAPTATLAPRVLGGAYLQAFDSCGDLLDYYRTEASALVGPYGLGGAHWGYAIEDQDMAEADSASLPGTALATSSGESHSTTNTQVEGVDEPDIVKTDGRIIVTSVGGTVQVVEAATATVLSTIRLPGREIWDAELLLHGDQLVVLSTEWGDWSTYGSADSDTMPAYPSTRTLATRVDLSDPARPVTLETIRIEGSYRSARMIGDTVRMVMVTEPQGLAFTYPKNSSLRAEDEAEQANRAIIAATTIEDWIPHLQVIEADGATGEPQPLIGCSDISRPREFSGLSTLSVVTFDLSTETARPTSTTGLVATGQTVYASTDRLIVATSPWDLWSFGWDGGRSWSDVDTDLHSFDISEPSRTTYLASGTVEGRLLSQFSLDERDGVIRVATTTGEMWGSTDSQSSLIVLAEEQGSLVETGRLDGLGLTEQIYAVRYLSAELAAVVTFRQVDPLYLIDTADPSDPRLLGELKIPGYSAYLHPLGGGYLLGIGQDADEETGWTEGLQASLFDISDPTDPTRVSHLTWENTYSEVEWDHRAFLLWEPTGQFFLPAHSWSEDGRDDFIGVLTGSQDGATLAEGPRASTARDGRSWGDSPRRTLVVGDQVWVVGYESLHRYDLASLEDHLEVSLRG